ncbi:MAG: hypothetical protein LBN21_13530, partial [Treponema sp.]|nr:hypothetical protein [Treponema sp.]
NTNRKVEEVEKGRKFSYPFFNLFDFAVKFLPIFSSFGITEGGLPGLAKVCPYMLEYPYEYRMPHQHNSPLKTAFGRLFFCRFRRGNA